MTYQFLGNRNIRTADCKGCKKKIRDSLFSTGNFVKHLNKCSPSVVVQFQNNKAKRLSSLVPTKINQENTDFAISKY